MKRTGLLLSSLFSLLCGGLAAQPELPLREILLYKNGMAYLLREGQLQSPVSLTFNRQDLNDVLKTIAAWDPDANRLYSIGYTSSVPLEELLKRFSFDLRGGSAGLASFLEQVQGSRLTLQTAEKTLTGRLMSVDELTRPAGEKTVQDYRVVLQNESGSIQFAWLSDVVEVKPVREDLRESLANYLAILEDGVRGETGQVTIYPVPEPGPLRVAYVQQFPVWKTSYRLDLGRESRLQAWAQIDNATGEAWQNVDVTLVSGMPVSFLMDLYPALYTSRAKVDVPARKIASPRSYEAAVQRGQAPETANSIFGTVKDMTGAVIPGAEITIRHLNTGAVWQAFTNEQGYYELTGLQPGRIQLEARLPGFRDFSQEVDLPAGGSVQIAPVLQVGEVTDQLTVQAQAFPQEVQEQISSVFNDQERIRENLKSLKNSDEEKAIRQRYVNRLDQQENRLEALRSQLQELSLEIGKKERELDRLISEFEWEGEV